MADEVRHELAMSAVTAVVTHSAHSDRGAVRQLNEDSFFARFPIFVVADGMGGHSFGDRASQAAVGAFAGLIGADAATDPQSVLDAVHAANDAVLALTAGDEIGSGSISGTTLTGIALVDVGPHENLHWMAFNVGDSRSYTWDGRHLTQLSVDHSVVQELVERGHITAAEAHSHPERNVVTRALGADVDVDPDIWLLPATARQTFILCSDGLTKELSDDEIAHIVVFHHSAALRNSDSLPMTLAERLVGAAIAAGGSDNVTVVVLECELLGSAGSVPSEETVDRDSLAASLEETTPRR